MAYPSLPSATISAFFTQNTCLTVKPMADFNTLRIYSLNLVYPAAADYWISAAETLYCVAQTLDATNKTVPFFNGNVVPCV